MMNITYKPYRLTLIALASLTLIACGNKNKTEANKNNASTTVTSSAPTPNTSNQNTNPQANPSASTTPNNTANNTANNNNNPSTITVQSPQGQMEVNQATGSIHLKSAEGDVTIERNGNVNVKPHSTPNQKQAPTKEAPVPFSSITDQ